MTPIEVESCTPLVLAMDGAMVQGKGEERHMAKTTKSQLQPWMEAQRRHHLTDTQVQMARELGLNPKKFGKLDNHRQEPWKAPLPQFIEQLYHKRFKRPLPLPTPVRPLPGVPAPEAPDHGDSQPTPPPQHRSVTAVKSHR